MIKIVGGVVVVIVVAVVAVLLLTGGDDDKQSADDSAAGTGGAPAQVKKEKIEEGKDDAADAPPLRTFARGRDEGSQARASAAAFTNKPRQIWLRVSAAPKQPVRVTWNLACAGKAVQKSYRVTPPDLRKLAMPGKANPDSCSASVGAQLERKGRVKVAILRDR